MTVDVLKVNTRDSKTLQLYNGRKVFVLVFLQFRLSGTRPLIGSGS